MRDIRKASISSSKAEKQGRPTEQSDRGAHKYNTHRRSDTARTLNILWQSKMPGKTNVSIHQFSSGISKHLTK
jgi:hypothetical protein